MNRLTRRDFVQSAGLSVLAAACCKRTDAVATQPAKSGVMLYSRPGNPTDRPEAGLHPLGLGTGRDGFIYVPPTYTALQASPLLVLMHGAGQSAREFTRGPVGEIFDKDAIVAVIPDSRDKTWDMMYGDWGPDVRFIDRALDLAFSKCRIDPAKIALGGFSDGATYALSLGITNANLFHTILAFSPGFIKPAVKTGKPRIFIGHGRQDEILPIDVTSREIVAALKEKNYPVKFEEFDGSHTMTRDEVTHAIDFFMGR